MYINLTAQSLPAQLSVAVTFSTVESLARVSYSLLVRVRLILYTCSRLEYFIKFEDFTRQLASPPMVPQIGARDMQL